MDCPLLTVFPTSPHPRNIDEWLPPATLSRTARFTPPYSPSLNERLSAGIYMILGVRASIGRARDAGIQ